MPYDFSIPDFLQGVDEESIHRRMLEKAPPGVNTGEGDFFWDVTRPVAIEKAELLSFYLVQTLKLMFPAWSYDKWLDLHAKGGGTERKPPTYASGSVVVTGMPGTVFPVGFKFTTPSVEDRPPIEYETKDKYTIGEDGVADLHIVALTAGTTGNAPAGTITMMVAPIEGVTSITNPGPITGGTEEEDDDELRERIDEIDAASEASFVGSDSDYKRWTEEVPGVGTALVVAEWDGPGTVKVVVIDSNGQPANQAIIDNAYNNIIRPDDRLQRKAPIGATVTVVAPTAKDIDYSFTLELQPGETEGTVLDRFKGQLQDYYIEAKKEGVVRYIRVGALLANTPGVKDFTGLVMNGNTANIELAEDEYPVTGLVDPGGGA